jgi:hypothetical protein
MKQELLVKQKEIEKLTKQQSQLSNNFTTTILSPRDKHTSTNVTGNVIHSANQSSIVSKINVSDESHSSSKDTNIELLQAHLNSVNSMNSRNENEIERLRSSLDAERIQSEAERKLREDLKDGFYKDALKKQDDTMLKQAELFYKMLADKDICSKNMFDLSKYAMDTVANSVRRNRR